MNTVLDLFHRHFEQRYDRTSVLQLTEDAVRYDFFSALMHTRNLRSWEIQIEQPIHPGAYVPRNNDKSKRGEKPQIDLAFGDGDERVYVEFAMFKRNSVDNSPINDTENAFKVLNDMMRLALQIHMDRGRGFFVCVADSKMIGKRLTRSDRFLAFPAKQYEFDYKALQDLSNLYTVGRKIDPRFLAKLQETGMTVRAEQVFERDLKSRRNELRTIVSAWKVEALCGHALH